MEWVLGEIFECSSNMNVFLFHQCLSMFQTIPQLIILGFLVIKNFLYTSIKDNSIYNDYICFHLFFIPNADKAFRNIF